MVEGRRRVTGASGPLSATSNISMMSTSPHLSRSRSVRQSTVRHTTHGHGRLRDHSSHRSPLATTNSAAIASDTGEPTLSTGEKCKEFARSFVAFIFSKVGLIVLVVGYAIGGALLFQAVEGPHEDKELHFNQVESHRNATLDELWQITTQLNIFSKDTWSNRVDDRIKRFQASLIEQIRDNGYDGSLSPQWTFSGSFLFALTVITTIGYGNIAPRTDEGKITTILYAIFGIPLMLLYLTNIGGILARSFRFVYGKFCLCGNRRKAAAIAATQRSRSIRLQRQRSVVTGTPTTTPVTPSPSTPARSPSTSRFKSLVSKSPVSLLSKSNSTSATPHAPAGQDSSTSQEPAKSSETRQPSQQLPSEASSPQTPGPSNVPSTEVPSPPTPMPGKQKSVTIAPQTPTGHHSPQPPATATGASSSFHHQQQQQQHAHRPPFIPFQSQFHPFYQHQMSMSSQSTGDQIFPESSLQPPHSYDSYYPYHPYPPYSPYGQMPHSPGTLSMPPVSPPPPVSALVAASTLGSTPAMSPTAAKAHCSRAAAITASASHAISAAASSSSQDKVHVPISLCLMILVAYVSGGGFLFSIWEEDWGYLEGSYFCFISLSTIGFGDLVPGDAVVAGEGGSQERLIICSLYLLTGLALIAMCFNLMQEEVIHKIRRIGQNLGIIKDPEMDQGNDEDEDEDEDEDDEDNDEDEHNIDHVISSIGDENVDQVTNNQVIVSNSQIFAPNLSAINPGQLPLHDSPATPMRPFNYPLVSPYHSTPMAAMVSPTPGTPSSTGQASIIGHGHHQHMPGGPGHFSAQLMTPPLPPPPPHPSAASSIMYSSQLPPPPPPFPPPPPAAMMQTPFIYNWSAGQS